MTVLVARAVVIEGVGNGPPGVVVVIPGGMRRSVTSSQKTWA